jgi:hypothetical protein
VRLGLDPLSEGVRVDPVRWIQIGWSGTDLGLQLARFTGFELDGGDLKSRRTGTRCLGPLDLNRTAQSYPGTI